MTFCPVECLLLSWLGSQIEILKSGLTVRSHLRPQKQGLAMRFQLRCQRHCTFPPWEVSKVDDILPSENIPHFSPDWGPKSRSQITTYNEVSFEISETSSYKWVSYWDLKTMSLKHWDLKSVVLFHHGTIWVDDVLPQLKIPLNFGEPFFRVRRFSKQKS
jgi:hypothetical protein